MSKLPDELIEQLSVKAQKQLGVYKDKRRPPKVRKHPKYKPGYSRRNGEIVKLVPTNTPETP